MCRSFRFTRWLVAIAILAGLCTLAPPAALAQEEGVALSVGPVYPSPIVVGSTLVPVTLTITNNSTGAVSINTAAADHKVRYVPACRTTTFLGASDPILMCQGAGDQDAGVFAVSATGTGVPSPSAVGVTGCNTTTFTFTATGDAAGTVLISSAAPIVLPVGFSCVISFTVDVLAVPTNDASVAAGVQTRGLANVDPNDGAALVSNNTVTGGGSGSTITTVFACPPGGACCPDGYFSPATTICRPSTGVCDPAESCTGSSDVCPADVLLAATTICRASTGVCDPEESCTGTSGACPADVLSAATTICRASTGVCDPEESCTGTSGACPADVMSAATTVCRASTGVCDPEESCTGSSGACPADVLSPATTTCNADLCQSCSGTSGSCGTADLCAPEACRTPGYWAQHAGQEKSCATNQTSLVIASVGSISVCGQTINSFLGPGNTGVNHQTSPIEALCMPNGGDFRSQVVFQMTAAALNCAANGLLPDCSNSPLFGDVFAACNVAAVCAPTTDANKAVQALCVSALDCLNNGGHAAIVGDQVFCTSGTCSDNQQPCTPGNRSLCGNPQTATCDPGGNCHNLNFTGFPDSCAGSQDACKAANKNSCTIFGGCGFNP